MGDSSCVDLYATSNDGTSALMPNDSITALAARALALEDVLEDLPQKKRKFVHTSEAQRRCMLEWLEQADNFALLTAPPGTTVLRDANGKRVKKTDGFRALTRHVNAKTKSNWTMETTKSRYESFMTTYRKAKALAAQPDFAVTENDRTRGISTITQKLNSMCVYFDRIDALFHPKPREDVASIIKVTEAEADDQHTAEAAQSSSPMASDPGGSLDGKEKAVDELNPDKSEETAENRGDDDYAPPPKRLKQDPEDAKPETEPTDDQTINAQNDVPSPRPVNEETLRQLAMEREHLALLQEQLAVQKRELDLRERELQQQEEERKRTMKTEIVSKLIQVGKNAAEIKEILEVVMPTL